MTENLGSACRHRDAILCRLLWLHAATTLTHKHCLCRSLSGAWLVGQVQKRHRTWARLPHDV